ncbi:MAG TPA: arylsulfatase [Arachidicoccus sp.]
MKIQTNSRQRKGYFLAAVLLCFAFMQNANAQDDTTAFQGVIGKTLSESKEWWAPKPHAPKGAPNVLIFLLDDAGYGTSSAFGGLMETPTLDSLANHGLRYTNFHTTAICGPTRAALLTGRNHHSVHMGYFNYSVMGFPGYDGLLPFDKATIAEILHQNHYNTYMVGKFHLTPISDITSTGPFDRWPLGLGFDHFYGWHLGHTDQYHPNLYEDNQVINVEPNTKNISTLLADKAISYIANQRSANPDNPFFLYFATGAIHEPHQADKAFRDMYEGKFDKGWDWYRETVFERQKKLGVIPPDAQLPLRDPTIQAWDSLTPEAKKLYAKHMEVYAAQMTQADYELSRVIKYLKEIGQLDNTLIFAIVGDNGSSHSVPNGTFNGAVNSLPKKEQIEEALKHLDEFGTQTSDLDAPSGWTQATNTPFRLWKADANSEGGTHNPLIVFWPDKIKEAGIRNQYGHVIDLAPTIVDLTGISVPKMINGYTQKSFEGTSLAYTIKDSSADDRHTIQYYELRGKRAIYDSGWKAEVYHQTGTSFNSDIWELYNLKTDFNERVDLAKKYPEKLKQLEGIFDEQANKYNVYPLIDGAEDGGIGGRKRSAFGMTNTITLYPGVDQFLSFSGPQLAAQSFSITANIDNYKQGDDGVLYANGGSFDGLSLFIKDGKFQVAHNTGTTTRYLESQKLPEGNLQLRFELNYIAPPKKENEVVSKKTHNDKDAPAGTEVIYINNVKISERPIVASEAKYIGCYIDAIDVGQDLNSAVSGRYTIPFKFPGNLKNVVIEYK